MTAAVVTAAGNVGRMGRMGRMGPTGRIGGAAPLLTRRGWTAVAAVALCLMALGAAIGAGWREERLVPTESVVVGSGDTLWSIAEERRGAAGDVRDLIAEIRELNGLETSQLVPGDVLDVPKR
ncbi:MAG: LysM peptidoglycan-binding domain-containing protein [Bifidobacteriaceae bacterium]|jgi:hypothetical protein|nr:LysM peptidoglycan-binding domain-containing protein [Bifidobacteriaceae bacterium]